MSKIKNIKNLMKSNLKVCTRDMPLSEAAGIMAKSNCGCLPVVESVENRKPIGMITDRDIVVRSFAKSVNPIGLKVKDCMTNTCYTVRPDASLAECNRIMKNKKVGRLVVVDSKNNSLGVISKADLFENKLTHKQSGFRKALVLKSKYQIHKNKLATRAHH